MWWIGSSSTAVTPSDLRCAIAALGGEAGVRAAQVLAHAGMPLREALDVRLVDDGLVPRDARAATSSSSQSKLGSITTHFGIAARVVRVVEVEVGVVAAVGTYGSVFARAVVDRRPRSPSRTGRSGACAALKRWPCSGAYGPWTR